MKKNINVVLIIAVLALWGTAGYRYVKNYFFIQGTAVTPESLEFKAVDLNIKRDTFLLEPLSRDPFLKKVSVRTVSVPIARRRVEISESLGNKTVHQPIIISWPDIKYYGFIKSGKNNELALIKVNGTLIKMHKGDSENGLIVKNIYGDSIVIVKNRQQRSFMLNK